MKLKNKKTGEIGWLYCDHISIPKKMTVFSEDKDLSANHWDYSSLAELNDEWEDYKEPEVYCYISDFGAIRECEINKFPEDEEDRKQIGNYFETEEDAEKAVEKLKAWKRLKDKGFGFINFGYKKLCKYDVKNGVGNLQYQVPYYDELEADLDLLFGGGE